MEKNYTVNPKYQFKEDKDEALLFNVETGAVILLNETGSFIYKLITEKFNKNEIVEKLQNCYQLADKNIAEDDVSEFFQLSSNEKIIEEIS